MYSLKHTVTKYVVHFVFIPLDRSTLSPVRLDDSFNDKTINPKPLVEPGLLSSSHPDLFAQFESPSVVRRQLLFCVFISHSSCFLFGRTGGNRTHTPIAGQGF